MNKAFVREPDDDGHACRPRMHSLGQRRLRTGPLDIHMRPRHSSGQATRSRLGSALFPRMRRSHTSTSLP